MATTNFAVNGNILLFTHTNVSIREFLLNTFSETNLKEAVSFDFIKRV